MASLVQSYPFFKLALLYILSLITADAGETPLAFSTCKGPCTITLASYPVKWSLNEYFTISNTNELSSVESYLSSSYASASCHDETFEIQLTGTPIPQTIQTAVDGYTTVSCCDEGWVYQRFLTAEGTTCGTNPACASSGNRFNNHNAAFATFLPNGGGHMTASMDGYQCEIVEEDFSPAIIEMARPDKPKTKMYYGVLVDASASAATPARENVVKMLRMLDFPVSEPTPPSDTILTEELEGSGSEPSFEPIIPSSTATSEPVDRGNSEQSLQIVPQDLELPASTTLSLTSSQTALYVPVSKDLDNESASVSQIDHPTSASVTRSTVSPVTSPGTSYSTEATNASGAAIHSSIGKPWLALISAFAILLAVL